jgi:hypothetical protein
MVEAAAAVLVLVVEVVPQQQVLGVEELEELVEVHS